MVLNRVVLVVIGLGVEAYAPIQMVNHGIKGLAVLPEGFPRNVQDSKTSQNLIISNSVGNIPASRIPYFSARPDQTITWDDMDWCLEVDSNKLSAMARVNNCNGGAVQKWNWIPNGQGSYMLQLHDTKMCLDVREGYSLEGASIELWDCENSVTQTWAFEDVMAGISESAANSFGMRHAVLSLFALAGVGVLGVSAWRMRWNATRDTVAFNMEESGGITLATPTRSTSISMSVVLGSVWDQPGFDIPIKAYDGNVMQPCTEFSLFPAVMAGKPEFCYGRNGDVRMETLSDLQDLANKQQVGPFEAIGVDLSKKGGVVLYLEQLGATPAQAAKAVVNKGLAHTLTLRGYRRDGEALTFEDARQFGANLKQRFELSDAQLLNVLLKHPSVLGFIKEWDVLLFKVDWLQKRLGLDNKELMKIVLKLPSVLGCSEENNLQPKLDWLQNRLGLDNKELTKVVLKLPSVLGNSVEDNLQPKLDWLQKRLGLDNKELTKVVLKMPSVLGYSVEDNLQPKLDWLQKRLGLDNQELAKVVLKMPSVLGYSVEDNLQPKLNWMQQEVLGLSVADSELPKLDWTQRKPHHPPEALRKMIVAFPPLLSYSLNDRYRPRLEACRSVGADDMAVIRTIAYSPERFDKFLRKCQAEYCIE